MGRHLVRVLVLVIMALAVVVYLQQRRVDKAEGEIGLESSRILSAVFTATGELKVARLSGEVLAEVDGASVGGVIRNNLQTRAPYSVEYFVDLRKMSRSSYRWNAQDRIMSVDIPDVVVAAPNIDMSRARTKIGGVFVSRWSSIDMQKRAAGRLSGRVDAKAKDPLNLDKAREGARLAISRFVQAPLSAAGISDVKVVVRLPSDVRPTGMTAQQWDMSKSVAEVLANHR